MTRFVFCFPDRNVGGVPILFGRVARELASNGGHEVFVVDFADGAMANTFAGNGVTLIEYHEDRAVPVPPGSILIYQTTRPWALFPSLRIPDGVLLFFWNCHPFNLVPTLPGWRSAVTGNVDVGRLVLATVLRPYRATMRRFTKFLLERKALVFMDQSNIDATEQYLRIKIANPVFLPVCAGSPPAALVPRSARNWAAEGLRLAWIGRLADFKHHILERTLLDVDEVKSELEVPIEFTIIGDGPYKEEVMRVAAGLRNVQVEFAGELPPSAIESFLTQNVDVLFAMGASALEGIRVGVPTVLLDVSYAPVPAGYVYSWLHERPGFTLGSLIATGDSRPGNRSLSQALERAMAAYGPLSEAAAAHYCANHACTSVAQRLAALAPESRCFYPEFVEAGFAARDPLYQAFSYLRARFVR